MAKRSPDPVHCWLVWRKADKAARDFLYRGIQETGISDTDFRVLEALLHKGPLPVNTIGPKVHLTPGSISVAIDRLLEKGFVSRTESPDDRRVRIVALTNAGKDLILPIFRKHSAEIGKVFARTSPKELQTLESVLKKAGKRARALAEELAEKRNKRA
jgi:MarR family 2-MHQ and catechol resistance regulon transcriptional repressor